MLHDPSVIMLGEDIGKMGGPFGSSIGLLDEFGPERIIETPISEEGFVGMAVGAAIRGLRPVVELMYNDFISVCLDPVMNQAAKIRYMTGGQVTVPLVLRAPMGVGRGAAQHSQCMESLFAHIPGLKLICPGTATDAKGLLKAAIREDDPVIFLEHKGLYSKKEDVPEEEYVIPIGEADVKQEGSDVTVVTWSRQVHFAIEAAQTLASEDGLSVEVLDLRTLVPLDWDAIEKSVRKTHRVVVLEEGVKRCGMAAEIAASIGDELFDELDAPVVRVAGMNTSIPFSPTLEPAVYPHPPEIVAAIRRMI
jgi:pyruvate dehydrogenase E1 component beta subunit